MCGMLPKLQSIGMVALWKTASCCLQAREAKQQGAAAKHERKLEAREARHEGHHGIRASLDKGADFARGRVASMARKGSGTVAPSRLAGACVGSGKQRAGLSNDRPYSGSPLQVRLW